MPAAKLTRRGFLGAAAAATSALLLPPSLRDALASTESATGSLDDIEHVIILMQENRSFDHYFGTLSGVRGFAPQETRLPRNKNVFYQPDPVNPDGYELPFHLDTYTTSATAPIELSHAWPVQHRAWNNGTMDGWISAHRAADGDEGPLTMGYHTRRDIPFHYALADAFTICDMYFSSVMGPTRPNRLYMWTGTINPEGGQGGPIVANPQATAGSLSWTTYPERLQAAGISWRIYWVDYGNMLGGTPPGTQFFKQYQEAPEGSPLFENAVRTRDFDVFAGDVANNRLPQVTWLLGPSDDDEHPGNSMPAKGALYVYNVLEALASNRELWSKTVLFLTYDENHGFFDHVAPPTPPPGTPGEFITAPLPSQAGGIAGPIGLGFRVPMTVISPWSQGGWLSSEVFDHTSLLRFLEVRFGVREPQITAWRRRTCGDLTSTLRLRGPKVSFPTLESPADEVRRQEESAATNPPPVVPTDQRIPDQERGQRKRLPG